MHPEPTEYIAIDELMSLFADQLNAKAEMAEILDHLIADLSQHLEPHEGLQNVDRLAQSLRALAVLSENISCQINQAHHGWLRRDALSKDVVLEAVRNLVGSRTEIEQQNAHNEDIALFL